MTKGKLFGHIISQEGVKIDLERVKAIQQLSLPLSKTGVNSFFSQVHFFRGFVPNFSKIVKCIVDMIKGNKNFKWSDVGKKAFEDIKGAL